MWAVSELGCADATDPKVEARSIRSPTADCLAETRNVVTGVIAQNSSSDLRMPLGGSQRNDEFDAPADATGDDMQAAIHVLTLSVPALAGCRR
jgi:hypothetical protein